MISTQLSQTEPKNLLYSNPINKPFRSPLVSRNVSNQNYKARACKTPLRTVTETNSRNICLGIKRPLVMSSLNSLQQSQSKQLKADPAEKINNEPNSSSSLTFNVPRQLFSAFKSPLKAGTNPGSKENSQTLNPTQDGTSSVKSQCLNLGIRKKMVLNNGPKHDPNAEDAIVLYRPEDDPDTKVEEQPKTKSIASILDKSSSSSPNKKVAVVVDPILGKKLRPHQVEGIKFIYECVTGRRVEGANGCIMADEMGLGKTLQCIALMWSLLKQSPDPGKPTIDKCIIVCPSSLVKNWESELIKWLGSIRISAYACDNKGSKEKVEKELRHFVVSKGRMNIKPVLIISYETLRMYTPILGKGSYGLMLCDEGHRLKNCNSQTFIALNSLPVRRRVILTGTPVQNDLTEYFSLLNFANPGLLGDSNEFRRNFENPILRGRDSEATDKEKQISDKKLAELANVANKVIIRRTNDLLSKYLPIKYEYVVFCPLSDLQTELYEKYVKGNAVKKILNEESGSKTSGGDTSLQAITILKKLCNHPALLKLPGCIEGSEKVIPDSYYEEGIMNSGAGNANRRRAAAANVDYGGGKRASFHPKWSGKMSLLDRMLKYISKSPEKDKIVLISNYTQTLDLFEELCKGRGYGYLRLDGSLSIPKRMQLVDQFNNPNSGYMIFLLSSKAGGCGLNLVGANRLVLFDPDWNPATDQQALARVWRDGQKKTCYIYRFVCTGTIEEKIFQRQSHKVSISSCVVDERDGVERHFSKDQMKELFKSKLRGVTECETHDTYKCKRCHNGKQFVRAEEPMDYGDASSWNHFSRGDLSKAYDLALKATAADDVTFLFQYKSH
ncbi:hypothetical protein BB560_005563 [Smittium megazygosporum]|uniref:DNA repair and recombination protein RAD54 n=1 Tax=Smittium megazygosporum TaxID=133381 RepID=A0A2T9Z388_9FUNG|nr:hypothetical protein BB560_005563 [Smittium megazygosporum]